MTDFDYVTNSQPDTGDLVGPDAPDIGGCVPVTDSADASYVEPDPDARPVDQGDDDPGDAR